MAEKKTLSAKEVVSDIRAGATGEFLMKKYGVSQKGFQSLFQKLVAAKFLTQVDLKEKSLDALKGLSEKFKISLNHSEKVSKKFLSASAVPTIIN